MKIHEIIACVGALGITVYAWFTLAPWQAAVMSLVAALVLVWEVRDLSGRNRTP